LETTFWLSNILNNSCQASCDVIFDSTLKTTLLSEQLLMTWIAIVSLSSYLVILPALVAGNIAAPATIWATIGAMGFAYIPLTKGHNFLL
jgi:hypothetical protein